jgi:hypothetical protein
MCSSLATLTNNNTELSSPFLDSVASPTEESFWHICSKLAAALAFSVLSSVCGYTVGGENGITSRGKSKNNHIVDTHIGVQCLTSRHIAGDELGGN